MGFDRRGWRAARHPQNRAAKILHCKDFVPASFQLSVPHERVPARYQEHLRGGAAGVERAADLLELWPRPRAARREPVAQAFAEGASDDLQEVTRFAKCVPCFTDRDVKIGGPKLELTRDPPTGDPLPLPNRIQHFVLLLDLEKRDLTPNQLAGEIMAELVDAGIGSQDILIVIKERVVEDWILSDPDAISTYVGAPINTEDLRGKAALANLLRGHNIKYTETTIGCEMLKGVVCSRAVERSSSLDYLRRKFPADCWWLQR